MAEAEIKETLISELDPRFVKQIENAEKSLSKNPEYAADICNTVLNNVALLR